jgi:hypothetical protein
MMLICPGETGKTSVNAGVARLIAALGLVFVSVMVKVLAAPAEIVLGLNALAMLGEMATLNVAVLLTGPAPWVCEVVTPLLVLGLLPATELVTVTVTVQLVPAGRLNPLKLSAVALALNVLALAPVQVPPAAPALAIRMLTKVSVKPAPVNAVLAFGLVSVKVSSDVPFKAIAAGANALLIVGWASTVSVAVPTLVLVPAEVVATVDVVLV